MKLNCTKPFDPTKWHRHFAWWPVKVGQDDCRWLEYVERKYGSIGPWSGKPRDVVYRALEGK